MIDNPLDLNLLRLFATMAESPTLTVAADRSGMTRSNMSHRLKALEAALGTQLLRRTTRHVELTQAGQVLYQHCTRLLGEVDAARSSIASLGKTISGDVRVRIPTGLGRLYLAPLLLDFARLHPAISLRVLINDFIGDLISAEIDVALKITSAPPEDHVARKLCDIDWCLCAAPAYLSTIGMDGGAVSSIDDLARVDLIAPASLGRRFDLKFRTDGMTGSRTAIRVAPRLQSGDYPFLVDLVAAGLGVALLPRYSVWSALRDGSLVEVLPALEPEGVGSGLYLLTAPNRFTTVATRTLIDFVTTRIQASREDWRRAEVACTAIPNR